MTVMHDPDYWMTDEDVKRAELDVRTTAAPELTDFQKQYINEQGPLTRYDALEDGKPVGWAITHPAVVGSGTFVRGMYTEPAHRRKGVAKRLLKAIRESNVGKALVVRPKPFADKPLKRQNLSEFYRGQGFEDYPHKKDRLYIPEEKQAADESLADLITAAQPVVDYSKSLITDEKPEVMARKAVPQVTQQVASKRQPVVVQPASQARPATRDEYARMNAEFVIKIKRIREALAQQGYETTIPHGSGYRTQEQQAANVRRGVSRAPISAHQYGYGADIVPKDVGWNAPQKYWQALGAQAKREGLRWGGDWRMRDYAHVEQPGWKPQTTVKPSTPVVASADSRTQKSGAYFAPGLPDPTQYGTPEQLTVGDVVPWVVQEHRAQRAGLHKDIRAGKGRMLSWATKKDLPKPGGRPIALYSQPVHCFPAGTRIMTRTGIHDIKDVVEQRMAVDVLSVDAGNDLVYKPIVNFWKRKRTEPIVGIRLAALFSRVAFLRCTYGHKICTPRGKIAAGDLHADDSVLCRLLTPTKDQQELLLGTFLGDGGIDSDGKFRFSHSIVQRSYFEFKYQQVKSFFKSCECRPRRARYSKHPLLQAYSVRHPLFKQWRSLFFKNGKKYVPDCLLALLSPRSIAVWYQDDGSILRSASRFTGCSIATHGFDKASVDRIVRWFKSKWGITCFVVRRGSHGDQFEIRFVPSAAFTLFKLITPYMHPSMHYKVMLPDTWHQANCYKCGVAVRAHVKYCSKCIVEDVSKHESSSAYKRAYYANKTLVSPKVLNLRFGTWGNAKTGKHDVAGDLDKIPVFTCGANMLCDTTPLYKVWPVRIVKVHSHWRKYEFVYNIEVADTHTYVLENGVVVGNSEEYSRFRGLIPRGYGAGTVRPLDMGSVLITHADPNKIKLVTAHTQMPEEYTLVRMQGKKKPTWLMINTTTTDAPKYTKEHYKLIPAEKIDKLFDPQYVMSAKIDGASALVHLLKDRVNVLSLRTSARTGGPIVHTHRLGLAGKKFDIPPELQNTLLRGEIYGVRDNEQEKAIPAAELGGLLNSAIAKSLQTQKDKGIKLRMALFGAPQVGGQLTSAQTHAATRQLIQKALRYLPGDVFGEPPYAYTEEDKRRMWEEITSGKSKLTREGVVGFPVAGGGPVKVKPVTDYDVHVREIFPQVKGDTRLAGGFRYSMDPEGPVVGEVGTGFTREDRKAMMDDPERYLKRVARVTAQEKFPSGALRAPAYIALHEDYPEKFAALTRTALVDWLSRLQEGLGDKAELASDNLGRLPSAIRDKYGPKAVNLVNNMPAVIARLRDHDIRGAGRELVADITRMIPDKPLINPAAMLRRALTGVTSDTPELEQAVYTAGVASPYARDAVVEGGKALLNSDPEKVKEIIEFLEPTLKPVINRAGSYVFNDVLPPVTSAQTVAQGVNFGARRLAARGLLGTAGRAGAAPAYLVGSGVVDAVRNISSHGGHAENIAKDVTNRYNAMMRPTMTTPWGNTVTPSMVNRLATAGSTAGSLLLHPLVHTSNALSDMPRAGMEHLRNARSGYTQGGFNAAWLGLGNPLPDPWYGNKVRRTLFPTRAASKEWQQMNSNLVKGGSLYEDYPEKTAACTAFDLDGTLAEYDHWRGESHIGKPIARMVDKAKQLLAKGEDVRIFTARATDASAIKHVKDWTEKYIGKRLPVTNVKSPDMDTFYDDRAIAVERNTGKIKQASRACACGYVKDTYYDICPKCQVVDEDKDPDLNMEHKRFKLIDKQGNVMGSVVAAAKPRGPAGCVELSGLYVAPDYRKQGVASQLVSLVKSAYPSATLSLKPQPFADKLLDRNGLIGVYSKMGFVRNSRARNEMVLTGNYKSAAFRTGLEVAAATFGV